MAIVTFNYDTFVARYPVFGKVSPQRLQAIFDDSACLYLQNDDCSIVTDLNRRRRLLNLLVAHISMLEGDLNGVGDGNQAPNPVGRVSSASEGSVSASLAFDADPGSEQWYAQTPYGAEYWIATAPERQFVYAPMPTKLYSNNAPRGTLPGQFVRRFR